MSSIARKKKGHDVSPQTFKAMESQDGNVACPDIDLWLSSAGFHSGSFSTLGIWGVKAP